MKNAKLNLAIIAAGAFASVATVQASITGTVWEAPASGLADHVSDSVPAVPPRQALHLLLSACPSSLDFISIVGGNNSANYTIGSWLGTGGATILTGSGASGDTMNDVLIQLVGSVTMTSGQTFTVAHDDGLTLSINGSSVINVPGPTSPTVTTVTYTGPSGTFGFDLLYAEVDGAPACSMWICHSGLSPNLRQYLQVLCCLSFSISTFRILRKNRMA